jgi:saccharopine dehydrogenase-like NADP-dependent oxidoreductase
MRILCLGGAGLVGRYAARALRRIEPDAVLCVGDRDRDAARRVAAELGDDVEAVGIDVTDAAALAGVLRGFDVVVNTVGPYFRFGVPVLRAAIEAGVHYIDACDDWEPTLEMLALDDVARAAGVTAVIGMGISPGVTNLLAARAVGMLDSAHTVLTGWLMDGAKPDVIRDEPSAAIVHGVQQLTGTIRLVRQGALVEEKPIRPVLVRFPGARDTTCWTIGHPEPITLHRTFPALRESANVMISDRPTIAALRALTWCVDRGLVSPRSAARFIERVEGPARTDVDAVAALQQYESGGRLPPLFALAEGEKDGRAARVGTTLTSTPPGGMGGATGIPLGIGAALLASGALRQPGVSPPEASIPVAPFCDWMGMLCVPERTSCTELVVAELAWD